MRTLKQRFGKDADVFFTPNGYLTVASENGAQQLLDNAKLQKELGAVNVVLSKDALKQRYIINFIFIHHKIQFILFLPTDFHG